MPRAPKRCSKCSLLDYECKCKKHNWKTAKSQLPGNWKQLVKAVKAKAEKYGWVCWHCGVYARNGEVDHIINRARGGTDHITNLQWLCKGCHGLKTAAERRYGQQK